MKNRNLSKSIQADRPEAITKSIDVVPYKRRMHPETAVDAILNGYLVLIVDFFSSGLSVLQELKKVLEKKHHANTFQSQHDFRSEYRTLSNQILLEINHHKIVVRKSPEIGWLKILYPELSEFLLPFPQVQGLNSSWQWYQKGIFIPVLKRKIHPWFGTYFPSRFEHLELFNDWLQKYQGKKESAFDIGIGSGVLSFQMAKYGFEKIYGTDSNSNAIIGLQEELKKINLSQKIILIHGDLFANCKLQADLIVFNPPWIPEFHQTKGIDHAMYYPKDLFSRFFTEAVHHLNENGKLILLFSNLAKVTGLTDSNPIEDELASGNRFTQELFMQRKVGKASKQTKRNQSWRDTEMVELWVLKPTKNK